MFDLIWHHLSCPCKANIYLIFNYIHFYFTLKFNQYYV